MFLAADQCTDAISGHSWDEESLQSQKGVVLLVGVQERRALFVPLVNGWFCSSAGLHRNSFVRACTRICRGIPSMQKRRCTSLHPVRIRASKETFKRRVFDALESTRKDCPLSEQFCWHTVLPDPASPPRCAPRRDLHGVCPGFGLSKCFPGHALHEKGLQRQKGVVPQFGSQEKSALLVLVINR